MIDREQGIRHEVKKSIKELKRLRSRERRAYNLAIGVSIALSLAIGAAGGWLLRGKYNSGRETHFHYHDLTITSPQRVGGWIYSSQRTDNRKDEREVF